MSKKKETENSTSKRKYLSQTDVPSYTLDQALRIPKAICDNYADGPVSPLQLASALNMAPTSSTFRQLCGASIAYGLTEGGYNAQQITLNPLGKRIIKPLKEGDDLIAKREAILNPRVSSEFLNKYNSSPLPRHDIAMNVLEDMGVPKDKTDSVYNLIIESSESVGLLRVIKDKKYVDLTGVDQTDHRSDNINNVEEETLTDAGNPDIAIIDSSDDKDDVEIKKKVTEKGTQSNRRVFITHGKNKGFIEPIKKLLGFGELVPVVSVDKQSVSKPVPDKVMDDMRDCGAAIIHVEDEQKLMDKDANEFTVINSNVLIEIGAAMALYGRRFILLVKEGVTLPSNLQGLYEVRYKGDSLDGDATIKLLEAINDIKNNPLPEKK